MSEGVDAGRIHKPQCADDASLAGIVVEVGMGARASFQVLGLQDVQARHLR